MPDVQSLDALMLEQRLRDKLSIETDEFVSRMKAEILKTAGREVADYITEYIYEEIENVNEEVIKEVVKKGKSIIKSKGRKLSKWLKGLLK